MEPSSFPSRPLRCTFVRRGWSVWQWPGGRGWREELLDEVRLAIGEACTRAVALHNQYGLSDLVTVEMSDSDSYAVRVIDHAPLEASVGLAKLPPDELADESLTDEALTTGVGFALIAGLVDDLQVRPVENGPGTEVRMVWPVGR